MGDTSSSVSIRSVPIPYRPLMVPTLFDTNYGCERSGSYHVSPIVLQSFESTVLDYLRTAFLTDPIHHFNDNRLPLIYLVSARSCRDPTF